MNSFLFLAALSLIGFFTLLYTFRVLARLSRRIGDVTKMKPYYRFYYLSIALAALALASEFAYLRQRFPIVGAIEVELGSPFFVWTLFLPLALSSLIAISVTWRYWSWLLREKK